MAVKHQRTPLFPVQRLPGSIPPCSIDEKIDHQLVANTVLTSLGRLDSTLLLEDAFWRDLFCFTGTARTFCGSKLIERAWTELCDAYGPHDFKLIPSSVHVMRLAPMLSWIDARFAFRIEGRLSMTCMGMMRIVSDTKGSWKIWTLVTLVDQIDGFGNVDVLEPVNGIVNGTEIDANVPVQGLANPLDHDPKSDSSDIPKFDCVVVGAGFSGLNAAGRLKALGVPTLVLEKKAGVGDNWTSRYASLHIHTSRDHSQFPFARVWGSETPYHLSTADLSRGCKQFVSMYDLNIWTSTTLHKAFWDSKTRTWTLEIVKHGQASRIETKHVVFAIGGGGQVPVWPNLANKDSFRGTLLHTSDYRDAKSWRGLRCVVVGSGNSAHDVANDMLDAGSASVTMVQRGRTPVLPVEYYSHLFDPIYNDHIPVQVSDLIMLAQPMPVSRLLSMGAIAAQAAREPERFDALERAGFRVERKLDLFYCLYERFGGHYMDVGVSKKIAEGKIKVKSGVALKGLAETGLEFADGSTLDADVVVVATGFETNMRLAVKNIVGDEIGENLDDWWGLDREGELRGGWKPIGRMCTLDNPFSYSDLSNHFVDPGIWFTGGDIGIGRFYSRFLALQIKADLEGKPFQIYSKTPAL